MKGISAVIATILMLMITIAMAGVAYMYISGIFTRQTGVVVEIDETATTCLSNNTIIVYVRNSGTLQTDASKVTLSGTKSDATTWASTACGAAATKINAGAGAVACAGLAAGTTGTNTIVVSGPSNTARGSVYCQ